MTVIHIVTSIVEDLGEATVDTVLPYVASYAPSKKITRAQVMAALHKASYLGQIKVVRAGVRLTGRRGSEPSVYGPTPDIEPEQPESSALPVNSVFQLGERAGQSINT